MVLLLEVDLRDGFFRELNDLGKRIHELLCLAELSIGFLKLEIDVVILLRTRHAAPPLHHIYSFEDTWEVPFVAVVGLWD